MYLRRPWMENPVWSSLCTNKSKKNDEGVPAERQDWARDTVCLHTSMSLWTSTRNIFCIQFTCHKVTVALIIQIFVEVTCHQPVTPLCYCNSEEIKICQFNRNSVCQSLWKQKQGGCLWHSPLKVLETFQSKSHVAEEKMISLNLRNHLSKYMCEFLEHLP